MSFYFDKSMYCIIFLVTFGLGSWCLPSILKIFQLYCYYQTYLERKNQRNLLLHFTVFKLKWFFLHQNLLSKKTCMILLSCLTLIITSYRNCLLQGFSILCSCSISVSFRICSLKHDTTSPL